MHHSRCSAHPEGRQIVQQLYSMKERVMINALRAPVGYDAITNHDSRNSIIHRALIFIEC